MADHVRRGESDREHVGVLVRPELVSAHRLQRGLQEQLVAEGRPSEVVVELRRGRRAAHAVREHGVDAVPLALDVVGPRVLAVEGLVGQQPRPDPPGGGVRRPRGVPACQPGGQRAGVVRAAHEQAHGRVEPVGGVGAGAGHEDGRAVLERHADHARGGRLLLEHVAEGEAAEVRGRGAVAGAAHGRHRGVFHDVDVLLEQRVVPLVRYDAGMVRAAPREEDGMARPRLRVGVRVERVREHGAVVQQRAQPGPVERSEAREVVVAHLVHGDEEHQARRARRPRFVRGPQSQRGQRRHRRQQRGQSQAPPLHRNQRSLRAASSRAVRAARTASLSETSAGGTSHHDS